MLNAELSSNKNFMYKEIDFLKQSLKTNGITAPTNDIIYCAAPTDNKIYFKEAKDNQEIDVN